MCDRATFIAGFEAAHRQRYGFIVPDKGHVVEAVPVELVGHTGGDASKNVMRGLDPRIHSSAGAGGAMDRRVKPGDDNENNAAIPRATVQMWAAGEWRSEEHTSELP